jgi:deazaflavin-dependent oxidoreductase (nitroreductase family)
MPSALEGQPGVSLQRTLTRAMQQFGKLTVNQIVLASLRSGIRLPSVSGKTVIAVATVGRKSGKRRVTPMGYVRVGDDRLWVVSEHGRRSDWYRNSKAAGSVQVLVDRKWRSATLELQPDEDPGAVLRRFASKAVAAANRALWYRPEVVELRLKNS